MRDTCSAEAVTTMERRQSMTTWGMLALAVFVSVGMAEWSKRSAANEVMMDPKILEQAIRIAAERKMEDRKAKPGLGMEDWGLRGDENFNAKAQTRAFVEPIRLKPEVFPKGDVNATVQQAEISRYPNQNRKSINN